MIRRFLFWLAFLTFMSGCAGKVTYDHGVPNLYQVKEGLWRSGQPTTLDQWQYLASLGVRQVVKLNFESEASDALALEAGLTVHSLGIEPDGDLVGVLTEPDSGRIQEAEAVIAAGGGVLVHCTHGQDRTGLVVGISRVLYDGWSKDQAYQEMLDMGFHPELVGLWLFWQDV